MKSENDLIIGRNSVREALNAGRPALQVLVKKGEKQGSLLPIIAICKEKNIPVKEVDLKKLDYMCKGQTHQGVIMIASPKEYCSLSDIFDRAEKKNEDPFIVVLDSIEDPHNLGAIIRSAECAGAHGVVIPERRGAGLSYAVDKASAGALEYMNVARVANLNAAVKEMKSRGLWVFAADMRGSPYYETDLTGPVALIIGSEGGGVGRLLKENADKLVSIPMKGNINSLNASVAAGIIMFEAAKNRVR